MQCERVGAMCVLPPPPPPPPAALPLFLSSEGKVHSQESRARRCEGDGHGLPGKRQNTLAQREEVEPVVGAAGGVMRGQRETSGGVAKTLEFKYTTLLLP